MIHAINANHEVICELKGIQKSFDRETGHPLRVLEDINLDVRANEVVCLIGPSGCGKSTSLRMLAGLFGSTGPPRVVCWLSSQARNLTNIGAACSWRIRARSADETFSARSSTS